MPCVLLIKAFNNETTCAGGQLMDSYIALTLFGVFLCWSLLVCPFRSQSVLRRSFNAVDVSLGYRGNHCFATLANGLDNFALLAIPFFIFAGR